MDLKTNRFNQFFEVNNLHDVLRVLRVPALISLQSGKLFMMIVCGCEVNELNNWVSHAIRTPWYWRTAADGTRFVAGPYSSLWYWLDFPAHYGYWTWMSYLWIIDLSITLYAFVFRSWKFLLPYMMASIYFYNVSPIDVFVFWLSILPILVQKLIAVLGPVFALLVKLPVDAPFYVWQFIFHNPYGIHEPGGLFRYTLIGLSWLSGVGFYLWHRLGRRSFDRRKPTVEGEPSKIKA